MSSSQFSSSPPSSATLLSEHKPIPAAQSKVHDLARRYSAMAKQSGGGAEALVLPHDTKNRVRGGSFGRTEGSKVSSLLGKYKETTQAAGVTNTGPTGQSPIGRFASKDGESQWTKSLEEQTTSMKEEDEELAEDQETPGVTDFEGEIESTLKVSDLVDRVHEIDLVDIPLSNTAETSENVEEITQESDPALDSNDIGNRTEEYEDAEAPIERQDDYNLAEKSVQELEQEEHQEQLRQATETIDENLQA